MKEQILAIVLDPIFWGIIATAIMIIVSFFIVKSGNSKYQLVYSLILKAFLFAEKAIPDNTENKAMKKADIALKVLNEYLAENNLKMTDKLLKLAKQLFIIWSAKQKGIV
ncbi:MAG: hypothetical protein WC389_15550 [Lutibacter sp.]|jgi:hypothetical protein